MNYLKKIVAAVAVVLVMASVVSGDMLTSLVDRAEAASPMRGGRWFSAYDDQSKYPNQNDRYGTIVRFFDSVVFTNPPAKDITSPVDLKDIYYGEVPTFVNYVVLNGFIQVVQPNAGTNWILSCEGTGNLKAAGNWLATTGIKVLEVTGAATALGPYNGTQDVVFTWSTGSTLTNASFLVVLDVYLGQ